MKKSALKKYARLIASVGANIKKGQDVVVRAQTDSPEFVRILVEECYRCGASKVEVEWDYQPLTKLHVKYRKKDILAKIEDWELERLKHREKTLPAMIYLLSEDPDGLAGIDREKYAYASQQKYKVIKPIRDNMENKYQWCIAAVPGKEWAKKVFPGSTSASAVEKLWQAILYTSRADGENPVEEWKKHNEDLKNRCDYLNSKKLKSLHYTSSNGTDFTVGLMENAQFLGGGEYTLSGDFFNPNIPSEEVFITPKKGEAEGIVYSTRPLSYRGELIEDFSIKFENGKATEVNAKKNKELLEKLISMDEGAAYLGECALVPYDSPIRNSNILFYNTLFDENAACHLALGSGFTNCIKDYGNYTIEECHEMGVNDSMVHEDFMIGDKDLSIDGITYDGEILPIFRNGNWAF